MCSADAYLTQKNLQARLDRFERIAEISLRIIVLIQKYALFDIADITFSDFIAHKLLN